MTNYIKPRWVDISTKRDFAPQKTNLETGVVKNRLTTKRRFPPQKTVHRNLETGAVEKRSTSTEGRIPKIESYQKDRLNLLSLENKRRIVSPV